MYHIAESQYSGLSKKHVGVRLALQQSTVWHFLEKPRKKTPATIWTRKLCHNSEIVYSSAVLSINKIKYCLYVQKEDKIHLLNNNKKSFKTISSVQNPQNKNSI